MSLIETQRPSQDQVTQIDQNSLAAQLIEQSMYAQYLYENGLEFLLPGVDEEFIDHKARILIQKAMARD